MAKKLKRVGVLSLGIVFAILYAIMGLIIGVLVSLFSIGSIPGGIGILFGAGSIIILPIFYGVIGFIFGIIGAALYNLVASWTGGIEFETQ